MQYSCEVCAKVYSTNFNRLKHIRKVHDETLYLKKSNINCLECKKTFKYLKDYRSHLNLVHDRPIRVSVFRFTNFGEFKTWKRKEEIATNYQYVAIRGATNLANGCVKKEFTCHRSGFEKHCIRSKNSSKRHCSYKLNATCPASMEVIIKPNGAVDVIFNYSHTDHGKDIKYLTISREERAVIGTKLAEGCSFNEILECVENLSNSGDFSSRFLKLTRKDLHNIRSYFLLRENFELDETSGELRNVCKEQYANVDDKFIESDITKNHKRGGRIKKTDIIEHPEKRLVWNIKSHEIKMLKPLMCDCDVKCSTCKICVHMFQCNCYEASSNDKTICSHIHALVSHFFKDRDYFIRTYMRGDDNSAIRSTNNDGESSFSEMELTSVTDDHKEINIFGDHNGNETLEDYSSDIDNNIIVYSIEFSGDQKFNMKNPHSA